MQKVRKILTLVLVLALLLSTPGIALAVTDSTEATSVVPADAVLVGTELELWMAIRDAPTDGTQVTIALTDDIVMGSVNQSNRIIQGRNILLTSSGIRRTIYQETPDQRHFSFGAGSATHPFNSLTLENIVLSGERTPGTITHYSGGVDARNGTLIMRDGAVIRNSRSTLGGGVYFLNGGNFIMEGGEIRDNVATTGGGVRMSGIEFPRAIGTFVMNGGVIADNTARGGGGISLGEHMRFTMNGGEIVGNTAVQSTPGGRGGGISAGFASTEIIINDGIIRNNSVYRFISGNNVLTGSGGGIAIGNDTRLTIHRGFLTGNRAEDGGAIATAIYTFRNTLYSASYNNITIGADVVFSHNFAGRGAFPPPTNAGITNIHTTRTTIHNHPLNNNDIAFRISGATGTVFDPGPCPGIENLPGPGDGNGGSGNGTDPDPFPFADVAEGRWYHPAVVFVHENGIMQGTAGDRFAPTMDFSRAMVVTTLFRMYHDRIANTSDPVATPFDDVAEGRWYAPYIAWAHSNGIVQGVSETRFQPQNAVSRQEFATMIYRFAQFADMDVTIPDDFALAFPDTDRVGSWAEDAVAWAVYNELIQGTGGQLVPTGTATRAQAATILMRFVPMLD